MESQLKSPIRRLFALPDARNIAVILVFGLVFSLPNLSDQVLLGHDTVFHIARYTGTWRALLSGQLLPQLDPSFYGGFGYAINLFYPPLGTYVVMFTNLFSPNWNIAINAAHVLMQMAAGVAMYYFIKHVSQNQTAALISAIAYVGAPYMIANFSVRFAAGEAIGLIFAPVLFLGVWKIVHGQSGWVTLGIGAAGLLLSHNLSAAIFAVFALLFMIPYLRELMTVRAIKQLLLAAGLTFGLAAFFLLPFIEAIRAADYHVFQEGFMTWREIVVERAVPSLAAAIIVPRSFYVPFSWVGFVALFALICLPFVFKRLSVELQKFSIIALIFSVVSFFMTTRFFPWEWVPESLLTIQFPWRFNMVFTVFLSAMSGIVFTQMWSIWQSRAGTERIGPFGRSRWSPVAIVGALALVTGLLSMTAVPHREDADDWNTQMLNVMMVWNGEYVPVRAGFKDFFDRDHEPAALTGDMSFSDFTRYGRQTHLVADVRTGGILELPLLFYPGHRAFIDGERVPVFESENGFVAFEIASTGVHSVESYFGMSPATQFGIAITAATILGLAALALGQWLRGRRDGQYSPQGFIPIQESEQVHA